MTTQSAVLRVDQTDTTLLSLFQIIGGAFLLAAFAQIRIPIPFISPVPITGQTFGILLLGAHWAASAGP